MTDGFIQLLLSDGILTESGGDRRGLRQPWRPGV